MNSRHSTATRSAGANSREALPDRATFYLTESKPGVAQLFLKLADGGYVGLGAKAEEWGHAADGFMWHDVFHLALAAVLAWSPVCRAMLEVERRSSPYHATYEDCLRARMLEEAILALVFCELEPLNKSDAFPGISDSLWLRILVLSARYEVKVSTREMWSNALQQGFAVWKQLLIHRCGHVTIDLQSKSITFAPAT